MQMLVKILTEMLPVTPTTGGRADAIDILPKPLSNDAAGHGLWILLTDDDDITATTGVGAVCVLKWDGWRSGYKAGSGLAFPGLLLP